MQRLAGHETAVVSVTCDKYEEAIFAGASSGRIKCFDLMQGAKGEIL
jgi:hypothetical protein